MSNGIGIVALSFAKRAIEPNPVNQKLAEVTDVLNDNLKQLGELTLVVAQWEVARGLKVNPQLIVTQADAGGVDRNGSRYLDSQDVLNKAYVAFRQAGITDVAVVANGFLHKSAIETLVKKAGFKVFHYNGGYTGFDNSSLNMQWWCKGPIRLVIYLGIQVLGKLTRQNFHGIGEKPLPQ